MKQRKITARTGNTRYRALYYDEVDGFRLKRMSEKVFDTRQECLDFICTQRYKKPVLEAIKIIHEFFLLHN